jgi:hypothetical protein
MTKLYEKTLVMLDDTSFVEAKDLVVGDIVFTFDNVTETQQLAIVTSVSTAAETGYAISAHSNSTLSYLPVGAQLLTLRNEAYRFGTSFYSYEDLPVIHFDDSLRTVTAITAQEAYDFGATLNTMPGNWSKDNLCAYLAGVFDKVGTFVVSAGTLRVRRINIDCSTALLASYCSDVTRALIGPFFIGDEEGVEVSGIGAETLYNLLQPYIVNFGDNSSTPEDIRVKFFLNNTPIAINVTTVELDVAGGILVDGGLGIL